MTWVDHRLDGVRLETSTQVLEVGSYDENGSVQELLAPARVVGIDMRNGPRVDIVALGAALPFPDATFDMVVSTELLEHDRTFWTTLQEIGRVLRSGGDFLLTARGNGFMPHAFPEDYWRFMPSAGPLLLDIVGADVVETIEDPQHNHPGIFCHGRRRSDDR
ncbi:MAG: class I SAM-dependent methyltransferase [Acidimicrobiales bacterium]